MDSNLRSLHEYANNALKDIDFNENWYEAQFVRSASDYDIEKIIYDVIEHNDIWGTGVPEPLIYVKNIKVSSKDIQVMGKTQDTLKIIYNGISYMKFRAKEMIEELQQIDGDFTLEIIGRGNINEWMGNRTPQIFIESFEAKQSSILDF